MFGIHRSNKNGHGLCPLFDRRIARSIRRESGAYYSFRVNYGGTGELPHLINETGLDIIKLCDGRHLVSDIVYEMSMVYKGVSLEELTSDIEGFLKNLSKAALLLWIGAKWIPRSPSVERIDDAVLSICDEESRLFVSRFLSRKENLRIVFSTDAIGNAVDPIFAGCSSKPSWMFALLDSASTIRLTLSFMGVDYGDDRYLNLDRIDAHDEADLIGIEHILQSAIRTLDAMLGEQPKPSAVRIWIRESMSQKDIVAKWTAEMGFAVEMVFATGAGNESVTVYSRRLRGLIEGQNKP